MIPRILEKELTWFQEQVSPLGRSYIIYRSERQSFSRGIDVVPYSQTGGLF